MRKLFENIFTIFIIVFMLIEILYHKNIVFNSIKLAFDLWINNIFPSLFPMFIVTYLLNDFGLPYLLGEIFKPIMNNLFKMKGETSFVFIMSLLSGFPSSAKYTKTLYDDGVLDENEASKLLTFTHFANPLFVTGMFSIIFINNKIIPFIILFSHYIGNIIIGIIFKNKISVINYKDSVSIKNGLKKLINKKSQKSFSKIISEALVNSMDTLILILGSISMFLVITSIININFETSSLISNIINGIFEITGGLKHLSILEVNIFIKTILTVIFISFGGISVHIQILSIISNTKIRYTPYLISRILHALISCIICIILLEIMCL